MKGRKCGVYLYAVDKSNQNTGFQKMGEVVFAASRQCVAHARVGNRARVGSRAVHRNLHGRGRHADISNVICDQHRPGLEERHLAVRGGGENSSAQRRNTAAGGYARVGLLSNAPRSRPHHVESATDRRCASTEWSSRRRPCWEGRRGMDLFASGITTLRLAGYTFGPGLPPVNVGLRPPRRCAGWRAAPSAQPTATRRLPEHQRSLRCHQSSSPPMPSRSGRRGGEQIYVRNDANTAWLGGSRPGAESSVIENASCKVDCFETTVTGWGIRFRSTGASSRRRPDGR